MARKVYVSDKLDRILEDIKRFGDFKSKKRASESLARSLQRMPLTMLVDQRQHYQEEEFNFLNLSD